MFEKVRKRNGKVVLFDKEKIIIAITKAGQAVEELDIDIAQDLANKVIKQMIEDIHHKIPTVEEIQDAVEKVLLRSKYSDTAKAFVLYRQKQNEIREISNIKQTELVDQYVENLDWQVKENSNMAYSLQGLNNYVSGAVAKNYWLTKIYPIEIRNAVNSGDFHIHDLDILAVYCVGWDLQDLLAVGFRGVAGKIECKPAKHLRAALGQLTNFFFTMQGEAAGAQAISNFDTLLAPFIRYDKVTRKDLKQDLQNFMFNMNVPTRVGFQTPFTNVTLDLVVPSTLANQPVMIAGKPQKETYKDFQKEMDLFNDVFAEVIAEGDASGRVFTFPIPTYNITKDFDWDNPRLKNLWKMTAKYGIPYFSNFINSDMDPEDARSMCPLGPNEEILIRSSRGFGLEKITLQQAYFNLKDKKETYYTVFTPNGFRKCVVNQHINKELVEIELANNHKIKTTTDHINIATNKLFSEDIKEISSKDLTIGMYLPYSLRPMDNNIGIYDLGYIVGCYAGDGSLDNDTSVIFSLSVGKKEKTLEKIIKIVDKYFGGRYTISQDKKLLTLVVKSKSLNGLCRDFVIGKERDKKYHPNVYNMSLDFRKGVKDGHYETDGGNRNRIYTSSYEMVKSLNMLAATMGTTTNVTIDGRTKESGSLSDNPIYTVRFYDFKSNNYGDIWYKVDNYVLIKIKNIEKSTGNTGYCLEMLEDEPIFTVANTGIVTHNCRLRLDNRELRKKGGGLFGANPLTGSIGVVTINLPRLGYKSKDKEEFFTNLERQMDLVKESLEIKRKILEKTTESGLYPYSKFYLRHIKKRDGKYWDNHFSTIGIIGMNEACLNLIQKDISTQEGQKFALEVMSFMKDRISKYQAETGNNYNLEATPAEGTAYRLAKLDKKIFPKIIVANESDYEENESPPYYTNSTQLPVNYSDDVFEVLDLQNDLQAEYTGGTVVHLYIGEEISDLEAMKNLIKSVCNNYKLPYFTISPTFSVCPNHGYIPGKIEKCKCGSECEIYARIVGYIRPIKQWNEGKRAEFDDRVTLNLNKEQDVITTEVGKKS
jgi:ribonucleoside-triphosphate reductase